MQYNLLDNSLFDLINFLNSNIQQIDSQLCIVTNQNQIDTYGYDSFVDLASQYQLKFLIPTTTDDLIYLHFSKLCSKKSFHNTNNSIEKYGASSEFFNINKNNKFSFLYYYTQALHNAYVSKRFNILNLGINKGDEFKVIQNILKDDFINHQLTGIDFSPTIIEYVQKQFKKHSNTQFICGDINHLDSLKLTKYDLIISIGTLQSTTMNLKTKVMEIVQNYTTDDGAIILGFPNCRWIDSQMIYGAKVPNYNFSELGTLINDISFCKKYLQQKKYRVMITGKEYLFLTAVKF